MTTRRPRSRRRSVLRRRGGSLLGRAVAVATTAAALLMLSPQRAAAPLGGAAVAAASVAAVVVAAGDIDPIRAAAAGDVPALAALAAASSSSSSGIAGVSSTTNFTALINAADHNGWTALHEASRAGRTLAVKFLVEHGADANVRTTADGVGPTPLGIARRFLEEDHPVVAYLESIGAEDKRYEEGVRVVVDADGTVVSSEEEEEDGGAGSGSGLWEKAAAEGGSSREDEEEEEESDPCEDKNRKCAEWAQAGICDSNKSYMLKSCRKSCGVCKSTDDGEEEPAAAKEKTTSADGDDDGDGGGGKTVIYSPPSPQRCADTHDKCSKWAEAGECDANPNWMGKHCKRSCGACGSGPRTPPCVDQHEKCGPWADKGECDANPVYMLKKCKRSCGVCAQEEEERKLQSAAPPVCVDDDERCSKWADEGECSANPTYMLSSCARSCLECAPDDLDTGEPQRVHLDNLVDETRDVIDGMDAYFRDVVFSNGAKYDRDVRRECKNRNADCSYWAAQGECEANPTYMKLHCAPACRTCEVLDFSHRCPIPENATDALRGPGDLNALFERIADDTDDFMAEWPGINVTVLSRPGMEEGGALIAPVEEEAGDDDDDKGEEVPVTVTSDEETGADENGGLAVPSGGDSDATAGRPWVVTMENFLTPDECDRLIELGGHKGYERSKDVGKRRFDGTYGGAENDLRTSENAWCTGACYDDPVTRGVLGRIEAVTGVPETNSESLQLLQYEVGQFYRTHHDYIGHHVGRPIGPRILTLYLYLNDVEAGGGTDFPDLGLTVMPKRGMALLWPSVLDDDPNAKDLRTDHQALPVERGVKYGANAWLHLRDYKTPEAQDCS